MNCKESQTLIHALLQQMFGNDEVKSEWSIRTGAEDVFEDRTIYAPRLDIAVGPFNPTVINMHDDVRRIVAFSEHPLIREISAVAQSEHATLRLNSNPRCLVAIEIEFSGSSKHILGDFANASMMGLVGIVVAPDANFSKVRRVGEYARALRSVRKAAPDLFTNTICTTVDKFVALLRQLSGRKEPRPPIA